MANDLKDASNAALMNLLAMTRGVPGNFISGREQLATTDKNEVRAALGQGAAMGWGDEAEAWLRSKLGQGEYDALVKKIRGEYGQYSADNPKKTTALEMSGGIVPGLGMMAIPGLQAAGVQQAGRSTLGGLIRLAGQGAIVGGISGAGAAEDGSRASGAASGAALGGVLGAAAPVAMRSASGAANWLRERMLPTESFVTNRAAEKMMGAMRDSGLKSTDITNAMARDASMKVPSVVANASAPLSDLAEAVAQRTGRGAKAIEDTLMKQKIGNRERTYQQVNKFMNPGEYYDELARLQNDLRTKAAPHYEAAYAHGEVADPVVLKFLELPQFKQAMGQAKKLLAAEGREMDMGKPTVEVLDQVKRGLDTLIEKQTDAVTGKVTNLGRIYVGKKNEFLGALDAAVPEYATARAVYRGDAEIADALRKGLNDFSKMDHEQVIKMVGKMNESERAALRTGVARDLYAKIMTPSGNFNAAQRIVGSPETQQKLQPLFKDAASFDLFKAAMEREAQLFAQANKILGGSPTGKRLAMAENLEESPGVGEAIGRAVTGGWTASLTGLALGALRKSTMTEKTAAKLADMLMSKDPHEVAAVVKTLESYAASAGPKAVRAGMAEAGVGSGLASAIQPAPSGKSTQGSIEAATQKDAELDGPDIEVDLEMLDRPRK